MRYWWVNQNQTHRQEIGGGYLWSPQAQRESRSQPFYESMREVAPGDVVFSFVDTRIVAIGIAASCYYESPKPSEFGQTGMNWERVGWRVRMRFTQQINQVRPRVRLQALLTHPRQASIPLRKSTASTATRMRVCAVI